MKEFHFKFIHRIIVTKKELLRFGFKDDDECLYCGESDSIDHTFIHCHFTKKFIGSVIQWFNDSNNTYFSPTIEQTLFGITLSGHEKNLNLKFNYTLLYMRHYIYVNKLHSRAITSGISYPPNIELKIFLNSVSTQLSKRLFFLKFVLRKDYST